jgi:diacylglycerol kinase family enzyme
VTIGDQEPVLGQLRTVLFANCGRLPGGVVLVPDARITDGMLDVAVADARAGVAGWAELFGEVVLQGTGLPSPSRSERWRAGRIDHARAVTATVELETPQRVQVDGDSLGRAVSVSARVEPGALQVRSQGEIA